MLITKHKAKMRQEEKPPGIKREETELDHALEKIIDKEKLANKKSSGQRNKKRKKKQLERNTGKALWNV